MKLLEMCKKEYLKYQIDNRILCYIDNYRIENNQYIVSCLDENQEYLATIKLNVKDVHPKIICLSGKAQSGKNEFANYINNPKCLKVAYGDYVKFVASQYYNWNGKKDEIGRSTLNNTGDKMRSYDKDIILNQLFTIINIVKFDYDYIIITDARFKDEIDIFKDLYETISIRIERNQINNLTDEQKNHKTETSLDNYDFDYYLYNDSTKNYKKEVLNLWNKIC